MAITIDTPAAHAFFEQALATRHDADVLRARPLVIEHFGDTPELADELVDAVLSGAKTATCSCLWEWEAEGESPPDPGVLTIMCDGRGSPRCLLETTEVTIRAYQDVDAAFAREEGEGDRTLASWRDGHWRYFERVLPAIGRTPTLDMPLVCERFRVLATA